MKVMNCTFKHLFNDCLKHSLNKHISIYLRFPKVLVQNITSKKCETLLHLKNAKYYQSESIRVLFLCQQCKKSYRQKKIIPFILSLSYNPKNGKKPQNTQTGEKKTHSEYNKRKQPYKLYISVHSLLHQEINKSKITSTWNKTTIKITFLEFFPAKSATNDVITEKNTLCADENIYQVINISSALYIEYKADEITKSLAKHLFY